MADIPPAEACPPAPEPIAAPPVEEAPPPPADDLMFSNGLRVFVPIDVEVDGQREARTIVLSQAAAASTSAWSFLISDDLPFHRFVGGELAKRLFLEAKRNGWEIQ